MASISVGDVQLFVSSAIGGAMVGETVEGVERYPINIRYLHLGDVAEDDLLLQRGENRQLAQGLRAVAIALRAA
jgi:Cu/Ag efflux pump CusA